MITKTVKNGKYELEYSQFIDDFGFKSDIYTVKEIKSDGSIVNYPFNVPLKAKRYTKETNIFDHTNEPTKQEMEEFLKNNLSKIPPPDMKKSITLSNILELLDKENKKRSCIKCLDLFDKNGNEDYYLCKTCTFAILDEIINKNPPPISI